MTPELTILLPVHNCSEHLPQALESLSAQTFGDWRCLALNDGSSDATGELLAAHAHRDDRFRILTNAAEPLGVPGALNHLLERVETELFARMDGDDISDPGRLAAQMGSASDDPEVALWGGRVEPLGEAPPGWLTYLEWANSVQSFEEIRLHSFTECPLPHPTWLGRTRAVRSLGGYREGEFPEDYDLFLRLMLSGAKLGKTPDAVLKWRDHKSRETRANPRYESDNFLRLKASHLASGLAQGSLPQFPQRPLAIWGAGKTGKILAKELAASGAAPECFIDPLKAGRQLQGLEVVAPKASEPGRHLILVAVRPNHLRAHLEGEFESQGRKFGRDYIWMY